jgi:SpoVK/Ycf46/Vps4 family AAA+-type ATPase
MTAGLFEDVVSFPDADLRDRYDALVGLDEIKERLEKEAEALLRPDRLEKWSMEKHGSRLPVLDLLSRRPPLLIFAGDVGTGKTELAMTFGDRLARSAKIPVELFPLSLRARGSGAVGEMTKLISDAFRYLRSRCPKSVGVGKKPSGAAILLIDEADALAQSRELTQMHHEDRAGVNALIRGIDDIANARLPCLTIMCSNRLTALDPAVLRRAAAIFKFTRPTVEYRQHLLATQLAGAGLSELDVACLAEALGADESGGNYSFTYSDITQRFLPSLVLAAYPERKITRELALDIIAKTSPTPPFKDE